MDSLYPKASATPAAIPRAMKIPTIRPINKLPIAPPAPRFGIKAVMFSMYAIKVGINATMTTMATILKIESNIFPSAYAILYTNMKFVKPIYKLLSKPTYNIHKIIFHYFLI